MRQRWIFAGLLVLMVGGIVAAVAWWGPDRDWDRHDRVEVVRVTDNGDTTTLAPGDTIIVERGGPRFFPFGLFLFPLGFFAFFFLLRLLFWGPPHRGGPGGPSAQWLDEWHRRQHQGPPANSGDAGAAGSGT